ncbi:LysE family translocator [Microvirga antarctica]|uniref:LysE family translocator n=1 Tax=Microvirga antarctica TaxID=2819233 RepID=UPI001B300C74|nr:LysE family transporter [Microvirga antarctica]
MSLDYTALALFLLAAVALLGSPGPVIVSLVATGRKSGFAASLRYFAGIQVGLAVAAGLSAAGLVSIILAAPLVAKAMTVLAVIYLIYLAYKVASAPPVGFAPADQPRDDGFSPLGGLLLGLGNPKGYLSFASLMGSYTILHAAPQFDAIAKWAICVVVMIVVDLIWLGVGVALNRAPLSPRNERILNVVMGCTIFATALLVLAA